MSSHQPETYAAKVAHEKLMSSIQQRSTMGALHQLPGSTDFSRRGLNMAEEMLEYCGSNAKVRKIVSQSKKVDQLWCGLIGHMYVSIDRVCFRKVQKRHEKKKREGRRKAKKPASIQSLYSGLEYPPYSKPLPTFERQYKLGPKVRQRKGGAVAHFSVDPSAFILFQHADSKCSNVVPI